MPYACTGCGRVFEPSGPRVGLFCESCRPVVCSTCNDTHRMTLRDGEVMCTRCPIPCQLCRQDGRGPFCEETPCHCECHRRDRKHEAEVEAALGENIRLGDLDLMFLERKARERLEHGTAIESVWWRATLSLITEVRELRSVINSPRTDEFFEAVRNEAAHQVERWGIEHDAGKRGEDWIALFMYLLGKATKAHYDGNRDKLLHHVITAAAVALNWHRNMTGENTRMRPGVGP